MEKLLKLSAHELIGLLETGELDSREVWSTYHARSSQDSFQALSWVAPISPVVNEPQLWGMPLALKDIFCQKGVPTTASSKVLENYRPPYNASVLESYLKAGGSVLSRTKMDEFAMGSSTENCAYGPVKNPWDPERVPGGSSGGSAAAVAGGLAPWALGTDTGGSVRQPAAFCGLVGLKPTYGSISRYGMIAFASSLDQAGTFTRNIADSKLLFSLLKGKDPKDPTTQEAKRSNPAAVKKLGYDLNLLKGAHPAVKESYQRLLSDLKSQGYDLVAVDLESLKYGISAYYVISSAEAASNLARYDGIRYGVQAEASSLEELYRRTRRHLGPEVKRRIMLGSYVLSAGYYDAYYGKASQVRNLIKATFDKAFDEVEVILTPTAPTPAFKLREKNSNPLEMYLEDIYTVPVSLAGLPALSVPMGLGVGLPLGVQLISPAWQEERLFELGTAIEDITGFEKELVKVIEGNE